VIAREETSDLKKHPTYLKMALRARALSTMSSENQVNNPNIGGLKKGLGAPQVGRSALGDIRNKARSNSVATDEPSSKEFKQPTKPVDRKNSRDKENDNVPEIKCEEFKSESMDAVGEESPINMEVEETKEIEDPDVHDKDNPQLVVEYVNDIYSYLRTLEVTQSIKAGYLAGQTEILPKMRSVLIDWLVGVHLQFHLLQETLYTTVAILDRFLQVDITNVTRKKLQLVGVSAMLIAAKYEEIYAPEVKDFVYITDRAYNEKEILKMEIKILATLQFDLGRPLPLHFLRRASKAGGVEAATHTLAKYIVELSLGVYNLADVVPSKLSAAALALAIRMIEPGSSIDSVWSPSLQHYTKYNMDQLFPVVTKLAEVLFLAPTAKLATVYQKFSNKKFMKISRIPVLEDPVLKQIAKGERK